MFMQVIAFTKMHSPKRLKITDVNPHLICVLCGGYYIDATTVIECLHSFCKSCIVKYLEKNKYCPICDVQIHKTNPLLNIRTDKTLQNIVYKLVPSLFKNEMQRRVEFYQKHPESLPAIPEQRGEVSDNTPVLFPDELLIICLEYHNVQSNHQVNKRYLHCPAALTISHLIKLIRGKFGLHSGHQVNIFYKDDPLMEHITLMDIAYTYQCRRKIPIHLTYRILELKKKTIRIITKEPKKESNKEEKLLAESEWKEVQLQISENGVMSVRNVESSECSPIPGLEAPPICSPSLLPTSKNSNHLCMTSVSNTIVSQGLTSITPPEITHPVSSPGVVAPVTTAITSSSNGAPSLINSLLPGNAESGVFPVPITSSVTSTTISANARTPPSVLVPSSIPLATTTTTNAKPPCIMFPAPASMPEVSVVAPMTISQPTISTPLSMAMTTKTVPGTLPLPSHSLEPCTVSVTTTMAAMKPTTNIVPTSYPIMSTPRPPTEPIVSVSKVSKDQVRKANSIIEVNKLSISRVPPGGMKEKGDVLNKIVNKLSPNERVIGNTSVTIRPVTNTNNPTKLYPGPKTNSGTPNAGIAVNKDKPQPTAKYKTLKAPTKQWNPSIDRTTVLMKQNSDQSKPARFFKMRNMPRFLGNPASGVKPLYACPEEPISSQQKQKLTLMKVDPKTIPTSSIPRSPTKQPPPYTPGSPKMSKQPPSFSDPKPYLSPRMPSPAHSGSFLPPNPYHLLYSGYPGFSPDPNRMLSPELIRSMCAYHPSLNPSIGMLFNPMHTLTRPQDTFKPEQTPAVQRIPPSKTETPPPPKMSDEKRPLPLPSPSDSSKCTPPPASPKSDNKAHLSVSDPSKVVPQTTEMTSQVLKSVEVKENHTNSVKTGEKTNAVDNSLVKMNCDEININNNISKESQPSQNSEGVTRTE
ncbi:polycomb group protein Psc [Halyomorpha halys]|uniref:polycomb group protein Psc n=1 Tax=Halyomorpha halys TaxID=286706 RepID=UPI0006D5148F|nr:polycomb group protein Psc-like [Halyomorpha halys]XP_014279990.1 polycomb group protein Psc-like [Halyomorpha halys]